MPSCRQGVTLAPLAARLLLPGNGPFGLETFWIDLSRDEYIVPRSRGESERVSVAWWEAGPLAR